MLLRASASIAPHGASSPPSSERSSLDRPGIRGAPIATRSGASVHIDPNTERYVHDDDAPRNNQISKLRAVDLYNRSECFSARAASDEDECGGRTRSARCRHRMHNSMRFAGPIAARADQGVRHAPYPLIGGGTDRHALPVHVESSTWTPSEVTSMRFSVPSPAVCTARRRLGAAHPRSGAWATRRGGRRAGVRGGTSLPSLRRSNAPAPR